MKKTLISILLVFVICTAAFAEITFSPAVYGTVGGAFCHPKASYMQSAQGKDLPNMRTSFFTGFDAMLLDVAFDTGWEVASGFSMQWTSQSLAAGIHVLQPYLGMGVGMQAQNHINEKISLGIKTRLLFCKFRPYDYKFDSLDIEVFPTVKTLDEKNFEIDLVTPITFSFKSDAVTTRAGIGFCIKYNVRLNNAVLDETSSQQTEEVAELTENSESPEFSEQAGETEIAENAVSENVGESIDVIENEGGQTV